jgi:hypothetical protein
MSTALREAAQQILVAWDNDDSGTMDHPLSAAIEALRAALAQEEQEPVAQMEVVFEDNNGASRRTPRDCQSFGANGQPAAVYVGRQRYVPEQEQEQEPVAYTGDVARRMREAGMTFHLGMPHAVVMQQMTRFHDLVCAEASIKSAAAFNIPPRREWQGLTEEDMEDLLPLYSDPNTDAEMLEFASAVEAKLKEKNA